MGVYVCEEIKRRQRPDQKIPALRARKYLGIGHKEGQYRFLVFDLVK